MNNKADPGLEYADSSLYFSSRIKAIDGQTVTLERAVPWAVKKEFEPCECSALREGGREAAAACMPPAPSARPSTVLTARRCRPSASSCSAHCSHGARQQRGRGGHDAAGAARPQPGNMPLQLGAAGCQELGSRKRPVVAFA